MLTSPSEAESAPAPSRGRTSSEQTHSRAQAHGGPGQGSVNEAASLGSSYVTAERTTSMPAPISATIPRSDSFVLAWLHAEESNDPLFVPQLMPDPRDCVLFHASSTVSRSSDRASAPPNRRRTRPAANVEIPDPATPSRSDGGAPRQSSHSPSIPFEDGEKDSSFESTSSARPFEPPIDWSSQLQLIRRVSSDRPADIAQQHREAGVDRREAMAILSGTRAYLEGDLKRMQSELKRLRAYEDEWDRLEQGQPPTRTLAKRSG